MEAHDGECLRCLGGFDLFERFPEGIRVRPIHQARKLMKHAEFHGAGPLSLAKISRAA